MRILPWLVGGLAFVGMANAFVGAPGVPSSLLRARQSAERTSYLCPVRFGPHQASLLILPSKMFQVVGTYFGPVDALITVRGVATRGWCHVRCFHLPLPRGKCHPGHVALNNFREAMSGESKKYTLAFRDPSHPSRELAYYDSDYSR